MITEINKDTFWALIHEAKEKCGQDMEAMAHELQDRLMSMGPEQAQAFHDILHIYEELADQYGLWDAANIMMEAGAKSVRAIASHCVMSDPASFRVQESGLTEMVFTDSIPYSKKCDKVKQLSIADMFAETIRRVVSNESISSQYII